MSGQRPTVFVSYSHKDEAWKDRLVGHLRVLEFEGELDVWDDRRIEAGEDWRPEIEQAIERATVAILIVSKHFLTSKFIREQELTRILSRRSRQQLRVIPLIAEPCAWQAVSALQGIQARPQDGRPLSAGSQHQIEADLAALALEIRQTTTQEAAMPDARRETARVGVPTALRSSILLLGWLSAPTVVLGMFTVGAMYWRLETHVRVDVVTRRVSFVVRGQRPQSLLNPSSAFSELTVERCSTVSFSAAEFRAAATGETTGKPRTPYSGRVRLVCEDPGAKITLSGAENGDSLIGALDGVLAAPGARVVLDVYGDASPALTVDVSTHQQLTLPIHRPLRIVTELTRIEPSSLAQDAPLAFYDARLPDVDRMIEIQSPEEGVVLIIRPTASAAADLLNARLPVESVQFIDEQFGREARSPLLESGTLSYPDYPDVPPVTVSEDEFLVLNRTGDTELRRIALRPGRAGLRLTLEGILASGAIGRPDSGSATDRAHDRWRDPRLTLVQVIWHGPRWSAVAALAVWEIRTTLIGFERWKKSQPVRLRHAQGSQ